MNDLMRAVCDSGVGGGQRASGTQKETGVLVTRGESAGRQGEVRG